MPKDNEVDEKVVRYGYTDPCYADYGYVERREDGNFVRYDDHAATVAELRAEVAENEAVINVWRRRCEAAERRVGELEAELRQAMELLAYATYHDGRYKQREYEKFQRPAYSLLVKLAYRFNVKPYDSVTGADPT